MKDTTRKRKERAFLRILKKAIDQSSVPMMITTGHLEFPHPKIIYANTAFCQMTGFPSQELLGKTPRILQGVKTDVKILDDLKKALRQGRSFSSSTTNYRKDGSEYIAEWEITPVRDPLDQITHYISVHKDITPRIDSETDKDEFLGVINHELKNPLTTIMGFTQLMTRSLQSRKDKKVLYYLSSIEAETKRINNLISDLRDFTKINHKNLVSNYEYCDFDELLRQVVKKFKRTIPSHKIYRRGKLKTGLNIDSTRINQVLINLLSNAVKYSPNADKIIINVERKETRVKVSIQDFGIGIPDDKQTQIFERYYRVNNQDPLANESSGLGLYIAAQIIKDHKGEIGVISKQGSGSTFYFTLPLIKDQNSQLIDSNILAVK